MTTLNAGNTDTGTFTSSQTISVTLDPLERARVSVRRNGVQIFGRLLSHGETVGPFQVGDTYSITATGGQIVYTIDAFTTMPSTGGQNLRGTRAQQPAASVGNYGWLYFVSDEGVLEQSNGVSWTSAAGSTAADAGIPTCLWVDRGTATAGLIKRVTDLGNNPNVLIIGDGTRWQPLGGQQTIYMLAAPITGAAGASSVCTLPSITVPGGLMGINGGLDIEIHTHTLASVASVANTISYTFGGFELFGTDRTTNRRIWNARRIMNRNSAAVQTVMANASATGAYEQAANDPKETTKDTTADVAMAGTATATHATSIQNRVDEFRVRWLAG